MMWNIFFYLRQSVTGTIENMVIKNIEKLEYLPLSNYLSLQIH